MTFYEKPFFRRTITIIVGVVFFCTAVLGTWIQVRAEEKAEEKKKESKFSTYSSSTATATSTGLVTAVGAASCATRMLGSLSGGTWAGVGVPALGTAMSECTNDILLALWKLVVFKMIRQITLNLVTKGDFGITWEEVKEWFYKDVVFQAAESVLNKLGLSLCTKFSLSVQIALYQSVAIGYYEPQCTFDQSEWAQVVADAFEKNTNAAWARLRGDFWNSFSVSTQAQQNEFGNFWIARSAIMEERDQKQDAVAKELSYSVGGVLGRRECEEDPKNPGKPDPTRCRVVTPGMMVSQTLFQDYTTAKEATFQSQAMADMAALLAEITDIVINQYVSGGVDKFEGWRKGQAEEAARDYNSASQK